MDASLKNIRGHPHLWLGGWRWRSDRLLRWTIWYCFALGGFLVALALLGLLAFFAYLAIGWWLGRKAWREVMWLEADEGVDVTAHAEACFILSWLWSHPVLIAAAWFTRSD